VSALKKTTAGDIAVLGSGELVSSLLRFGLIDELRLLVHPVLLGLGRPEFAGLGDQIDLKFKTLRTFQSGIVMLAPEFRPSPPTRPPFLLIPLPFPARSIRDTAPSGAVIQAQLTRRRVCKSARAAPGIGGICPTKAIFQRVLTHPQHL
jgi:RibD C-terminal domain